MTRKTFITLTALVALAVGAVALFAPAEIMASKGVAPNAAAANWIREVGILLLALGVMSLLVRGAPGSHTLRGFLVGSALVHVGLFPIEIAAYAQGVIGRLDGIVPNSVLHVVLAVGFRHFAAKMDVGHAELRSPSIALDES